MKLYVIFCAKYLIMIFEKRGCLQMAMTLLFLY
jgi:hypothetical protein